MQAEHNVGAEARVHAPGALANFARPIKENLALPPDTLLPQRIVRPLEIFRWILNSFSLKDRARSFPEIVRAIRRDRFGLVARQRDARAKAPQFFSPPLRHQQSPFAFFDGRR